MLQTYDDLDRRIQQVLVPPSPSSYYLVARTPEANARPLAKPTEKGQPGGMRGGESGELGAGRG